MRPYLCHRIATCALVIVGVACVVADAAFPWADSPKRGLGVSLQDGVRTENLRRLSELDPAWYYTWGAQLPREHAEEPPAAGFVPMAWGRHAPLKNGVSWKRGAQTGRYQALLGFNEPDVRLQANMSVEEALGLWPQLEATGLRLGSPACTGFNDAWLADFMAGVRDRGLRVDFLTVHRYGGVNARRFLQKLDEMHATHGLPIWLTEFAARDNDATTPEENRYTDDRVWRFMAEVLPGLEERDFVERYAWFSASRDNAKLTHSVLFEDNGELTALGRLYAGRDDAGARTPPPVAKTPATPVSVNTSAPARPPNIVLILTDDQGWTSLSTPMDRTRPNACSDYYRTPAMDRLADRGMRFSSGYAASPVCSPSRYSILYGKTPARLGKTLVRGPNRVDHSQRSLPQLLREVDPRYRCAHFGKWHLDVEPRSVGYDKSDGMSTGRDGGFRYGAADWKGSEAEDPKRISHVTRQGIEFMRRQVKEGQPFYLQLSHYAVHSDVIHKAETRRETECWPPGSVHRHAGFAAMLADLDAGIGDFMRAFDRLGLADNTYVFFTSDNGGVPTIPPRPSRGAHYKRPGMNAPLRRGKWDLTEGGIRVPFFVVGPGVEPGSQCDTPIVAYDLLPTFLELAGSTRLLAEGFDGGSFVPLLSDPSRRRVERPGGDALVFHMPHYNNYGVGKPHSALRQGDFKLLHFHDSDRSLLFNLQSDLGEQDDLSHVMPERVARMKSVLADYLIAVRAETPDQSVTVRLRDAVSGPNRFLEAFP